MLLSLILLPFIGSLLPLFSAHKGRTVCSWLTAAPPACALILLLSTAPAVFQGELLTIRWDWIPVLGLSVGFRLDGLAFLFALLILAIGLLVILYGHYYLSAKDSHGRFFCLLLLFMGAMMGVVTADNLLLMVVFWELTSLSSFLLIGFWGYRRDARRGARMALTVTGGGGLALLAGVMVIGHIVGSFELSEVLAAGDTLRGHSLYPVALILVLLGVFTKSAQFPFHFWLPHAMSAPTPVSAYLHSATMVKAGVFLLARLYPVLSGTELWFIMLSLVGLSTMTLGAVVALFKHDLKGLLAYSTISHLGLIVLLFGLDTQLAVVAALFHTVNHATFKASLFMSAGIVDHETGSRDIRLLSGLRHYMPITAALGLIAAAAMAGVPFMNGFLSTEMFLGEAIEQRVLGGWSWLIPAVAVFAKVFSVAYALRFIHSVFFGPKPGPLPKQPHEPPFFMRAPILILVALCLAVGILPALIVGPLLAVAAASTTLTPLPQYTLEIWHGFNLPLALSVLAMVLGVFLYSQRQRLFKLWNQLPPLSAPDVFEYILHNVLVKGSRRLTRLLESGHPQNYLLILFLFTIALAGAALLHLPALYGGQSLMPIDFPSFAIAITMCVAALGTAILHRQRLAALLFLSVVGLGVALVFARFSAPDLVLTQLSVEVVSIILLMLILFLLPRQNRRDSSVQRLWRDAVVAGVGGLSLGLLTFAIITRPLDSISTFFLAESVSGGGGTNVVNVVLVDFRGFDTFGEITVLAIAAIGIFGLLDGMRLFNPRHLGHRYAKDRHPMLLSVLNMPLLPLALMVSLYIFIRGHNLPGGGFIAGLITAIALILQYLTNGLNWTNERLNDNFHPLVASGVLIAGLTAIGSWFFGMPLLTTFHTHVHIPVLGEIPLATAMIFDLGVYLTVVGATLVILENLGKLKPYTSQPTTEP
jgi:multicomponent K+:H+ antiporter subunit A